MIDDPIVSALAERNPVRDLPKYDDAAERQLHRLLNDAAQHSSVRQRRVRPGWAAVVGVGVVAVVAAGIVVANQQHGAPRAAAPSVKQRPSTATSSTKQRFPTADASTPIELVVDRTTAALNSASDYILEADEIQKTSTGLTDESLSWQDQGEPFQFRTQDGGPSAQPELVESTYVQDGTPIQRAIDYRKREWAEVSGHPGGPVPISQTQVVVQDLKEGHDTVLGTDTIDGKPALHLSNDEPGMGREIWVDPSTYLLIRMTEHGSFGTAELDYTWIPRSDPSAAGLFIPQAPPGFTKVPKIKE